MKAEARLHRFIARTVRKIPWAKGFIDWIIEPGRHLVRMPLGVLLLLGSLLSFLPGFGIWMLPAGLVLLSLDVHGLRGPTTNWLIRAERWISLKWRAIKKYFSFSSTRNTAE